MTVRHRYRDEPTPHVAEWTTVSRLARRIDAWRDLARRAIEPNPFYEPDYLIASARMRGKDIRCIAVHRDGAADSELIGLLPVRRARLVDGAFLPALEFYRNDYVCLTTPLIDKDNPQAVWRCLIDRLAHTAGEPRIVISRQMPIDGPAFATLGHTLAAAGLASVPLETGVRAALNAPERFEHAFRKIASGRRKDMGRRRRRLREQGAATVGFARGNEPRGREVVAEFLRIEAAGWKGKAGTAMACRPETRAFAEAVFTAPNAELDYLALDGKIIAVDASVVSQGAVFTVKTTYDEAYAAYAPGLLLGVNMIRRLAESSDHHRADSCAVENHVFNELWSDRQPIGSLAFGVAGSVRQHRLEQFSSFLASTRRLKAWLREMMGK